MHAWKYIATYQSHSPDDKSADDAAVPASEEEKCPPCLYPEVAEHDGVQRSQDALRLKLHLQMIQSLKGKEVHCWSKILHIDDLSCTMKVTMYLTTKIVVSM